MDLQKCLSEQTAFKDNLQTQYENCSTLLLEAEEKYQETQGISIQLLKRCKQKDKQIERLQVELENIQSNVEDKLFIYKANMNDAIDLKLAAYINRAPLRLRSKMHFEREAPGVYRFARKKVFMKLEGETIVLRVGGGFLTMDEFVNLNCGGGGGTLSNYDSQEDLGLSNNKRRVTSLVYAGKCAGDRDFKAFYITKKTIDASSHLLPQASDDLNLASASNDFK